MWIRTCRFWLSVQVYLLTSALCCLCLLLLAATLLHIAVRLRRTRTVAHATVDCNAMYGEFTALSSLKCLRHPFFCQLELTVFGRRQQSLSHRQLTVRIVHSSQLK